MERKSAIDRENVITRLMVIHTWAEFARERDLQFFTEKHLEDIAQWSDDAIELLKEQEGKPLRCKTCTMRDKTGFCHRWNIEVKDNDYCSFGAWKGC